MGRPYHGYCRKIGANSLGLGVPLEHLRTALELFHAAAAA
jgi:hypothetical protein